MVQDGQLDINISKARTLPGHKGKNSGDTILVSSGLAGLNSTSLDFHANGKELTVEGVDTRWV